MVRIAICDDETDAAARNETICRAAPRASATK